MKELIHGGIYTLTGFDGYFVFFNETHYTVQNLYNNNFKTFSFIKVPTSVGNTNKEIIEYLNGLLIFGIDDHVKKSFNHFEEETEEMLKMIDGFLGTVNKPIRDVLRNI